jgi:hypothetical protein
MSKYEVLKTIIEEAGYQVMSFPAFEAGDATGFVLPIVVSPPEILLVYNRESDWFIRIPGSSHIYLVSKKSKISEVCLALLSYVKQNSILPTIQTLFMQGFDLVAISPGEWVNFEWKQQKLSWEKKGWYEINPEEEEHIWDLFHGYFGSNGFEEPVPSYTWDIDFIFQKEELVFQDLETDLTLKTLAALRQCTKPRERIFALALNHPCYYFDPYGQITDAYRDSWAVPVLPSGDSYYFFNTGFQFGILSRFKDKAICVFGQNFLDAFEKNKPKLFQKLLHINGHQVESH